MDLENETAIKLIQSNFVLSLDLYERRKLLTEVKCEENLMQSSKCSAIMSFLEEIHCKVSEKTLEIIFFKFFIGDLSINKIICELFNKSLL